MATALKAGMVPLVEPGTCTPKVSLEIPSLALMTGPTRVGKSCTMLVVRFIGRDTLEGLLRPRATT